MPITETSLVKKSYSISWGWRRKSKSWSNTLCYHGQLCPWVLEGGTQILRLHGKHLTDCAISLLTHVVTSYNPCIVCVIWEGQVSSLYFTGVEPQAGDRARCASITNPSVMEVEPGFSDTGCLFHQPSCLIDVRGWKINHIPMELVCGFVYMSIQEYT